MNTTKYLATWPRVMLACSVGMVCIAGTPQANAEDGVSASGKGITGGALLGAEVVLATEAAFHVKSPWAYVLGGVGGAAAGGVGGYYIEQGSDAKTSFYLLAGGMALVIPATVAVLQATAYEPPGEYTEGQPGVDSKPSASVPRTPMASRPQAKAVKVARSTLPPSLVGLDGSGLKMGVPAPEIRYSYTATEIQQFGVKQRTEVRMPVFQANF